jgi:cutinase
MKIVGSGGLRFWAAGMLASASASVVGLPVPAPAALGDPCPDVELVYARGTFEAPGLGHIGQLFADSLRNKLGGKSLDVYAVNYPASLDFPTAADGIIDAANKIRDVATGCPNTKLVLSGFSQGAAVMAYVTADSVPAGYLLPPGITGPMAPAVADHVAAVALFGKPSNGFLQSIAPDAPPITVGPLYAGKTIDLCVPDDPVCSLTGHSSAAHNDYAGNGMTVQAADYVVQKLASADANDPIVWSGGHR